MSEAELVVDGDGIESGLEPSGKFAGAIEVQQRAWTPSPLALLSEDDFKRRVQLAKLELNRMREIQRSIMAPEVDYGVIPGTDKPTLFQPGAQVLNRMAAYRPSYTPERFNGDGFTAPILGYNVRCQLLDQNGQIVGEGFGAANSWEKKHRYRYADKVCPECGAESIRRSKSDDPSAYYCWRKIGGCGVQFDPGKQSESLDAQPAMTENPDPHDLDNTLLKMSCKRAYVAATVQAHACSGQFAQDLPPEGQPGDGEGDGGQPESASRPRSTSRNADRPKPRSQDNSPISDGRVKLCYGKLSGRFKTMGYDWEDNAQHIAIATILEPFGVEEFADLKSSQLEDVLAAIESFE